MKHIIGYFLIFISIILVIYVILMHTTTHKNQTFSTYTLLSSSWEKYKTEFINKDGRVIDYSQNSITTSEGQSYALLRAVWMDDKPTFDLVWNWTKDNLKRPKDHLLGWRWGKKSNGSYGFVNSGDENSASDADTDIALALLFASKRWNDPSYSDQAKQIIADIWKYEVATAGGNRYLIAGNWADTNNKLYIDPSYLAPYAYRIFATVDKDHDWQSLVTSSYLLLNAASTASLDKGKSVGLPPDWVALDARTGQIMAPDLPNLTTNYSFDAVRVPWRVALDFNWNHAPEAKEYLSHKFNFLTDAYRKNGNLASVYAHDGSVVQSVESPVMYATAIGFLQIVAPDLAKKDYQEKLLTLYSNDTNSLDSKLPYYEQNWVWFGIALYNKQLPNLM